MFSEQVPVHQSSFAQEHRTRKPLIVSCGAKKAAKKLSKRVDRKQQEISEVLTGLKAGFNTPQSLAVVVTTLQVYCCTWRLWIPDVCKWLLRSTELDTPFCLLQSLGSDLEDLAHEVDNLSSSSSSSSDEESEMASVTDPVVNPQELVQARASEGQSPERPENREVGLPFSVSTAAEAQAIAVTPKIAEHAPAQPAGLKGKAKDLPALSAITFLPSLARKEYSKALHLQDCPQERTNYGRKLSKH